MCWPHQQYTDDCFWHDPTANEGPFVGELLFPKKEVWDEGINHIWSRTGCCLCDGSNERDLHPTVWLCQWHVSLGYSFPFLSLDFPLHKALLLLLVAKWPTPLCLWSLPSSISPVKLDFLKPRSIVQLSISHPTTPPACPSFGALPGGFSKDKGLRCTPGQGWQQQGVQRAHQVVPTCCTAV